MYQDLKLYILASTFPTAFAVAHTLVNVSGSLASKFVVGAAFGWMTLPSIVGALFDRYHRIVPLVTLSASIINSLIMLTVQYRAKKHKKSAHSKNVTRSAGSTAVVEN